MNKHGWWKVKFELTLDGKRVSFFNLSESTQEHIVDLIKQGYHEGEIIEESEEE